MVTVNLFLGQCGVQIGQEIAPFADNGSHIFCDSEPKAIREVYRNSLAWDPDDKSFLFSQASGYGGNWAYAYGNSSEKCLTNAFSHSAGVSLVERQANLLSCICDAIEIGLERLDNVTGFNVTFATGGGTGSGVSSRILEYLRAEYPRSYIGCLCIAPSCLGDSTLQSYNSCLSLQYAQEFADCILLKDNDNTLRQTLLKSKQADSIKSINRQIAFDSFFLFRRSYARQSGHLERCGREDLLRDLCPLQDAKFIDSDFLSLADASIVPTVDCRPPCHLGGSQHRLLSSAIIRWSEGEKLSSGIAPASTRNPEGRTLNILSHSNTSLTQSPTQYWGTGMVKKLTADSTLKKNTLKSTVLFNSTKAADIIMQMVSSARIKLEHRAYLHWFERYGCEAIQLEEAINRCQDICDAYSTLGK